MYCPICRGEYVEGFTYCKKCDAQLVGDLPTEEQLSSVKQKVTIEDIKMFVFDMEKIMKLGGLVFIVISILYDITNTSIDLYREFSTDPVNKIQVIHVFVSFLFQLISSVMWGLFYISLGHIIHLLKDMQGNGNK